MLKPAESLSDKRLKIMMCCRNGQILFFMSFIAGHLQRIDFSSELSIKTAKSRMSFKNGQIQDKN
ncbi:unnamed protein product, partial [Nesidiocoris tenuis]